MHRDDVAKKSDILLLKLLGPFFPVPRRIVRRRTGRMGEGMIL
jgi:hypothetical protein